MAAKFKALEPPAKGTETSVLRTARTSVMGVEIFHEEVGSGPPLVLLHGLNDSHRTWRRMLPYLARSRRVLMPDLPGCGLSARPDACYSLDWQARVMSAWLGELGIEQADVVGHSYGGGVAQYMLLVVPQRIRRLGLVATGGLGREVSLELRLAALPWVVEKLGQPFMGPVAAHALRGVGGMVDAEGARWMREINARPGTARAFARTVRDVISWRGQTRHFLDRACDIRALPPIELFWGDADRVIPHAQALKTLELLRGAKLTSFAGCGHFPQHQQPEALAAALLDFFDRPNACAVHCDLPLPSRARRMWNRVVMAFGRLARPSLAPSNPLPGR
jgi:pimeloyl-ACP methyl ester carboxylesterase